MSRLRAAARLLWEFVVGDDWRTAAGAAVALGVTALAADAAVPAWWILPVVVVGVLTESVWRAARPPS